jgi:pyrroloquinoline-quinone synthase
LSERACGRQRTNLIMSADVVSLFANEGLNEGALSRAAFETKLRELTRANYYDRHPFHHLLHSGELSKVQVQAWALNRYCFQTSVPRKDAILISRSTDREFRREWTLRLLDHDGFGADEGGIARWLRLTDGLGLDRARVVAMSEALPKTHAIVDSYLEFSRTAPFVAAVATTLTELFSPQLHRERLTGMLASYPFVDAATLTYFKKRLTHAPRDASFALDYVLTHATDAGSQAACCEAVTFKCAMLSDLLDALHDAYVKGTPPAGAFGAR